MMIGPTSNSLVCMGRLSRCIWFQLMSKIIPRPIHTGVNLDIRFRDSVPATSTSSPASQDILLQNMRSAKETSDVLNAINRHSSIMNSNHAMQALKTLFSLQKNQSSQLSNGEVMNSKDFRSLCQLLTSQIRHLELNELIEMLKCLGYIGVPASSKIMSINLGLISKQVNDFNLQEIIFLNFILKDMKPTPLVKALKIALPIVFEANLQTKCNFDSVSQMSELLSFVCKKKNMERSGDMLVEALTTKREELSCKEATSIVFALCDSRIYNEQYQLLLHHSLDVITDSLKNIDFYQMESILWRLCSKHNENYSNHSYYHEEFCNGCIKSVIDNDYSFEQSIWILKKLLKFNHVSLPLLDHIAGKIESEPWRLEEIGVTSLITLLSGFSQADYKPSNWGRIKVLVVKACQNLQDRQDLPWLRLVLDLCIMDCWSEALLRKVFSTEFLGSFMSREYNKLDRLQLLLLDQVSASLSPWANSKAWLRAPAETVTEVIEFNGNHVTAFPLQQALHHGLGGQQYVISGAISPLGHFLDHVVVMRKGGYPVAVNHASTSESTERIFTQDIQIPPDSRMVAVLFVPSKMCAINNERVRGIFRIQINSIEALGIAVAPVLQSMWKTLPDFERIPYLMRVIREKLPSQEMTGVVTPV